MPPQTTEHLTGGAIAGIVISCLLGVGLLGLTVYLVAMHFIKRRNRRQSTEGPTNHVSMDSTNHGSKLETDEEESELEDTEELDDQGTLEDTFDREDQPIQDFRESDPNIALGLSDSLEISPANNLSESFDENLEKHGQEEMEPKSEVQRNSANDLADSTDEFETSSTNEDNPKELFTPIEVERSGPLSNSIEVLPESESV